MNVPFNVNLENKVVVVTGAGGIICSEFAKALAECGAKVALLDINYEAAAKFAEEIGSKLMMNIGTGASVNIVRNTHLLECLFYLLDCKLCLLEVKKRAVFCRESI